jgi:hypothetical protein
MILYTATRPIAILLLTPTYVYRSFVDGLFVSPDGSDSECKMQDLRQWLERPIRALSKSTRVFSLARHVTADETYLSIVQHFSHTD